MDALGFTAGAGGHQYREEMLFRGMGASCLGCETTVVDKTLSVAPFQHVLQPGAELGHVGLILTRCRSEELAQVVGGAAAADDQHASLAQRRQGGTELQMVCRTRT